MQPHVPAAWPLGLSFLSSYIIITALTEQQPFAFPLLISELIKSDFSTLREKREMLKNLLN
jgi:hypothetical protein